MRRTSQERKGSKASEEEGPEAGGKGGWTEKSGCQNRVEFIDLEAKES